MVAFHSKLFVYQRVPIIITIIITIKNHDYSYYYHKTFTYILSSLPILVGVLLVLVLPSGKHTQNYGKSQFSMGKSTINGHFQLAMSDITRG
jgi:low temperature requirement protein LtrA